MNQSVGARILLLTKTTRFFAIILCTQVPAFLPFCNLLAPFGVPIVKACGFTLATGQLTILLYISLEAFPLLLVISAFLLGPFIMAIFFHCSSS